MQDIDANHEITRDNLFSWCIQGRDHEGHLTWNMRAWITVTGPYVTVVGDISTVVFAYYSGRTPVGAVGWIGNHNSMHYVAEKASIGMSPIGAMSWDPEIAEAELRTTISELDEAYGDYNPAGKEENREQLQAAIDALDDGESAMYRELEFDDAEGTPGQVIASRVFFAHAALGRLYTLLLEQDECETNP